MKIILFLSLILNGVLLYLYLEEKNQPPLERILMEKHVERTPKRKNVKVTSSSGDFTKVITTEKMPEEVDAYAPYIGDQTTFERSVEDMEVAKKDFLEKNEMYENFEQKKSKIMGAFYEKSSPIHKKHPSGMTMSFDEKRKLIDMEQAAHKEIEKVFGKEKWAKYKNFVDSYNNKLIESYKSGDYSGVLMHY